MHVYIYDNLITGRGYEKSLAKIETRITDLGLSGKIIRLGIAQSVYDTIENELKKGAKTIVAVGGDSLLNKAIDAMSKLCGGGLNKKVPLGFIPVGQDKNEIAEFLGLGYAEQACDIIAARRVMNFDLVKANNNYFLTYAAISSENTILEIDADYSIEIMEKGMVYIINFPILDGLPNDVKFSATDGVLELFIKTGKGKKFLPIRSKDFNHSIFSFRTLNIHNKHQKLIIDSSQEIQPPVEISLAQEKLHFIVGKERTSI